MDTKIIIDNLSAEELGLHKYRYVYTLEKCEVSLVKYPYTNKYGYVLLFSTNDADSAMLSDHFGKYAFIIKISYIEPFDTRVFYKGKRVPLLELFYRLNNHTIDISLIKTIMIHNTYDDEEFFYHRAEEIYCE